MLKSFATPALALAAAGLLVGPAVPAMAIPGPLPVAQHAATGAAQGWHHGRPDRWEDYDRGQYGDRGYYGQRVSYAEPVYANTPVWRGRDGRSYCRKKDGTVGMIIGGAAGALLGREVDRGYNRTLGTIIGAAGGALLGRAVDRNGSRCR